MYLFRALNNYDILGNPVDNGIASKAVIFKVVKNYYDKNNDKEYHSLNDEEKEIFIKEHMEEYIKTHGSKLKNKYFKHSIKSRNDVKDFCEFVTRVKSMSQEELDEEIRTNKERLNFGSYVEFFKYISSLQKHLLLGSNTITDWISTTTCLNSVEKYYRKQDIHRIAVIKSDTGGLVDSDNILSVDLSTMDKIKEKNYLCNRIDINDEKLIDIISDICRFDPALSLKFKNKFVNPTDINSRGFKYANSDKEVCILKYIPRDHIVSVLEALQIDLIKAHLFNSNFIKLGKEEQKKELEKLKHDLLKGVELFSDPFVKHVFEELYLENKNIDSIVTQHDSRAKIIDRRNKILALAKNIHNVQIKR